MDKLNLLLRSRKFWAALIGLIMLFVKAYAPDFPLSEEQITEVITLLVAYVLGTALEDGLARKA